MSAVSSSLTIFTTCWPGLSVPSTSAPSARSFTLAVNSLDDLEVHVGLEQREADLAHGGVDVGLGQRAALADVGERRLELLGEGVEHLLRKSRDSRTRRTRAGEVASAPVLTVKRAVYLLLSLGLGITWFVILVVGLSTGVGLAHHARRHPDPHRAVLWATRPMADLERALVRGLLDVRTAGALPRARSATGLGGDHSRGSPSRRRGRTSRTSRVQFPLGLVWFILTTIAITVPLGAAAGARVVLAARGRDRHRRSGTSTPGRRRSSRVPIGAVLLVPARYLVDGMGIAHGWWARLLLHSEPDPELTAQVVDARSAQARIIAAADAERRRIERDLHDGAQQRLVALSLKLGMARKRLGDDADSTALQLVDEAQEESRAALEELRDLARGIHPSVLTDRGLAAALQELAGRATSPTEVVEAPEARLNPAVESAAYFVVAECLTNVGKYAKATETTVRVRCELGRLVVEVVDDGIGGADPLRGSGLRGLVDRVGALSGSLEVASPAGRGNPRPRRDPATAADARRPSSGSPSTGGPLRGDLRVGLRRLRRRGTARPSAFASPPSAWLNSLGMTKILFDSPCASCGSICRYW